MSLSTITALALSLAAACASSDKAAGDSLNSAFRYREVYLPEGIGVNARKLGLNTLDYDWGIWGHNLAKVLPEDHSKSVYAKINGNSKKQQWCFSSNHLYEYIEEFIDSKYDDNEYARFAIIPNDNDIVCLCEKCVAAGNSYGNASPAANKLVRRLAARFPNHTFYTSDYRTTKEIPADTMPGNTGVLVSAINFPLNASWSPEEDSFIERIQSWKKTSPRVVVWDYINNFDDYFTPYPVFSTMQRRLQVYNDAGATGVFLNGSGQDVSALSDVKTHVLAALTANPDIDWQKLLKEKATELYPIAGETIAEFMIAQENMAAQSGKPLPLYEGVEAALGEYLPEKEFIDFHDKLQALYSNAEEPERQKLDMLLSQLALTRLEIKRINGDLKNAESLLASLQKLTDHDIEGYNEAGWSIRNYVDDYNRMLAHNRDSGKKNKLKGEKAVPFTALDPQYSEVAILTDGQLGLPSNYHSGLLITSPKNYTQLAFPNKPGTKKIRVWTAYNPPYRIFLPEKIELRVGETIVGSVTPSYPEDESGHSYVDFNLPPNAEGSFILTFFKDPEKHSMAIEEIEAL